MIYDLFIYLLLHTNKKGLLIIIIITCMDFCIGGFKKKTKKTKQLFIKRFIK